MMPVNRRTFMELSLGFGIVAGVEPRLAAAAGYAPVSIEDHNLATLDAAIAAAPGPVAIDLWATWCAPCARFSPMFAEIAASGRYPDVRFMKFEVGAMHGSLWSDLAQRYKFWYIPAVPLLRRGSLAALASGNGLSGWDMQRLQAWFDQNLPAARA
jgi:thiol-disulfide isomerase/thioredoxin